MKKKKKKLLKYRIIMIKIKINIKMTDILKDKLLKGIVIIISWKVKIINFLKKIN